MAVLGMRRILRSISVVLIVSGSLALADAVATLVWQEPVSAYIAHRAQGKLARRLVTLERRGPTAAESRALAELPGQRRRIAFLARSLRRRTSEGGALGRIRIPKVGASFVIVNGTGAGDLRKGPGFYPEAPLPGAPGTAAIAGHRTTYLAPFRHIDRLRRGDAVLIRMPYADFTYSVVRTRIVSPTDLSVLEATGRDTLILSACHPLYSASKRIIVFSRLTRVTPRGSAVSRTLVEKAHGR
jgi:sortase A